MSPPPTRRRKWLRGIAWLLGGVVFLVVLAIVGVTVVLHDLQRPFVKSRVQRLVYHYTGIELDYESARASLTGLHLTGLTVKTPESVRALAPLLARVASVDVGWTPRRLMSASVNDVVLRDVDLTVVLDTDGTTSFDFLPPIAPGSTLAQKVNAVLPRSKLVGNIISTPLPLGGLTIEPIRATFLRADHRRLFERDVVEGLKLGASRQNEQTTLGLGTKAEPLDLHLTRTGAHTGTATIRLWIDGVAEKTTVQMSIEARILEESVAPDLAALVKPTRLASLVLTVDAEPETHRIFAKIANCTLADGVAVLSSEVELFDDPKKRTILHFADGHVDAKRALQLAPPRFASTLPHVDGGFIELHGKNIELATIPRVLEGGQLDAHVALDGLRYEQRGLDVVAPRVRIDVSTAADRHLDAKTELDVKSLHWQDGPVAVALEDTKLELDANVLELTATTPTYSGTVAVEGRRVRVTHAGRTLAEDPLHATLHLEDVRFAQPVLQSTAKVQLDATLGPAHCKLDAKKSPDALDYTANATSPSMGLIGVLVGKLAVQVPWSHIGVQLASKGELRNLSGTPSLRHDTKVDLLRPSMHGDRAGSVSAKSIAIALASRGTTRVQDADLTLGIVGLQHDEQSLGDGTLVTHVLANLDAPSIAATLSGHGSASPGVNGKIDLAFERKTKQVRFDVSLALAKLETLGPLVPALHDFDLDGVEAELHGKGALTGVVDTSKSGGLKLAADPLHRVRGDADLDFTVKRFGWHDAARWVTTPEVKWKASLRAGSELRTMKGELEVGQLHFAIGPYRFDAKDLSDMLVLKLVGNPDTAVLEIEQRMHMASFRQELASAYATGDVSLSMKGSVDHAGVVRVPEVTLVNQASGTRISLAGGVDLSEDRRALSVRGTLDQDLGKLWTDPKDFTGRGHLTTEVHVESGDLTRFHTATAVRVQRGDFELPKQKIKIMDVDCEIPIVADIQLGVGGAKLVHDLEVNNYSELRFADQHPRLAQRSFLTAKRIETPWFDIAPLVANLAIENRTASISQMELGVRGGHVTGRGTIMLAGRDTKAEVNLRANGVRSTHNEPFDGNAALAVAVRQRSVDGRMEVLRMGRRHLLDLLALVDPLRTDAAINRVRKILILGYPDHVRVSFNRGFASAKIKFGGIARLFKLDEISGIPMGPIVDRVLAPLFHREEK